MTDTTPQPAPETPIDRAALSAKLWEIAEHHIVAEWICCEPLEPKHHLCAKGYVALGMAKTLLVDSPEAWNPAAPLLDAIIADLEQLRRERDLAIAHDRQPYPTAWAYEQACEAREAHRERADAAEVKLGNLRAELAPYEMLAPQQCAAGKHADWLVDSEYAHACPWCRIAELERPAVEAKRAEIRSSYVELIAQAEQDRDYEGAFDVQCRLREREEQWAREDAAAEEAPGAAR